VLRPPLAQERLRLTSDGHVVVTLKSRWRDGTTHLRFEPVDFLGKLAALIPRPRVNLLIYSGVLAPHARWRARVVAYGRPDDAAVSGEPDAPGTASGVAGIGAGRTSCAGPSRWMCSPARGVGGAWR